MKEIMVYSEKLGKYVKVEAGDAREAEERGREIIMDDIISPMAGWVHNGWNNDSGGAGW